MQPNWISLPVAALIPLIFGMIWYHTNVFGAAWMQATGLTMDQVGSRSKIKTYLLTYLIGLLVAAALMPIVIHQMAIYSVLANEPGINDPQSEIGRFLSDFMGKHGSNFRSFKHGALHGVLSGIFFVAPLLGFNALMERKSFRYFAINAGFWIVCLAIMGGIICGWV